MEEEHFSTETYRGDEEAIPFCHDNRFTLLSYEKADCILQNVLRACGYKEAHMKRHYAAL